MKIFISMGMGVNSVALVLWAIDNGYEFEAVFADHGSDHPKTYQYVDYFNDYLVSVGQKPVTVIQGMYKDKEMDEPLNLYDYCIAKKILPSMMFRWCTEKFKIKPIHDYVNSKLEDGEECEMWIGIASDESHRANAPQNPPKWMRNKHFKYPFVDEGIDRHGNECIIKAHGLELPPKSGCYYCPYQKASELKKLYKEEPDLYFKVKQLETNVNEKRVKDFKEPIYIKKYSVVHIVQEGQLEMDLDFSDIEIFEDKKPCLCGI